MSPTVGKQISGTATLVSISTPVWFGQVPSGGSNRCRLPLLTYSAPGYKPKCGGMGGGGGVLGSQKISTAVNMDPKKTLEI